MQQRVYPDVLGAITGGTRRELPTLQCALGVFPAGIAVGQPFEVVVILQSMIARPQDIALALRLPRRDPQGNPLSFTVPHPELKLQMSSGEVGIVHLPVIPRPPTPPARGYPLILRVLVAEGSPTWRVRLPGAGAPPDALTISPFRLEVLREIAFSSEGERNQLHGRFDVIPGYVRSTPAYPAPKYQVLWKASDVAVQGNGMPASGG